jgi:hypothetical protein
MHVRFSFLDLVGDPRQRSRTVDQDLEQIPLPRRRIPGGEASRRRVKSAELADSGKPAAVMGNDEPLDRLAYGIVES